MRRNLIALASTMTAVGLLLGYHTSTNSPGPVGPVAASAPVGDVPGPSRTAPSADATLSPEPTAAVPVTATVPGDVVATRWGDVQVQVTVSDGQLTDVVALRYPDQNDRDRGINARALPILAREALDAQSAQIDSVSGATVTSDGYRESLQSAIDAAYL